MEKLTGRQLLADQPFSQLRAPRNQALPLLQGVTQGVSSLLVGCQQLA